MGKKPFHPSCVQFKTGFELEVSVNPGVHMYSADEAVSETSSELKGNSGEPQSVSSKQNKCYLMGTDFSPISYVFSGYGTDRLSFRLFHQSSSVCSLYRK